MGSVQSAIEVVGAVWLGCLLLFAFGYPLWGILSGANPSDPMPKWAGVCAAIAVAPKALIAGGLYVVFIWIPSGAIKLLRRLKHSIGYGK